jgi:DNA-binding transcriptional MerR regulator
MSLTTVPDLLSIGAFARRSRLSHKALRVYAELGLLAPAWVDPESGYRFYRAGQIERARLIGLLRRLDMPLARIGQVLELPGCEAAREIATFWAEIEADAAVKRRLVAYLERHLEGRGEPMYSVDARDVPAQEVATIQRSLTVGDLPAFIEEGFNRLQAGIREAGAKRDGAFFVVYHGEVNNDADGPVELCLPFRGSVGASDEISTRTEEAHREAYTVITRQQLDFPGILDAYAAVERWIKDEGREMTGSPREVYFVDGDAPPDEPFCDIAFPIARA